MSDAPKLLEPPESRAGKPFWDASREERFVLPWCTTCAQAFWYPREVCPRCFSGTIEWRDASGDATVYAVSVQHKTGPGRDPADGPYAVAIIDLPEGVRMMTNVVGCEPDEVGVGMAVRLGWTPLSDGRNLPQFSPA